ncbi:MAG: hypothetical protein ABH859_03330 [Pseudomonadota bacterium]
MKKVFLILIGLVVIAAIGVSLVFWFTSGLVKTADSFFINLKNRDYQKAYIYVSEDFKISTPQNRFIEFLNKSSLMNFKKFSWDNRSISGEKGTLEGSVVTDSDGIVPVKMEFVKEKGEWKIYSISKPNAGLVEKPALLQENEDTRLPSESEAIELVSESLMKFAVSVRDKDFTGFHNFVSNSWKKELSVNGFSQAFKSFTDADINIVPVLESYPPVFDQKPTLSKNGILTIKGHYPTRPSRISFELKYIYEGLGWKLVGTNVYITPVQ